MAEGRTGNKLDSSALKLFKIPRLETPFKVDMSQEMAFNFRLRQDVKGTERRYISWTKMHSLRVHTVTPGYTVTNSGEQETVGH
jgi:hypothetical protein